MKKKVGKILVALEFLREEKVRIVFFKYFIPVKSEIEYFTNKIIFTGESELFDEISECDVIPFYEFFFFRSESGEISLEKSIRL